MRIGMQTWGSDGDIRPMIALGRGLAAAGHRVILVLTSVDGKSYAAYARPPGFAVVHTRSPLADRPRLMRDTAPEVVRLRHPARQLAAGWADTFALSVPPMQAAARALAADADLLIGHFCLYPLQAAAERAGRPWVAVVLAHCAVPDPGRPALEMPHLGPALNPLGWRLARALVNRILRPSVNRLRRAEGLPPVNDVVDDTWISRDLTLVAVSPAFYRPGPGSPDTCRVCGALDLPPEEDHWTVPAGLGDFLSAGPAPVYMTFGSLLPHHPGRRRDTVALLAGAARRAGCRAVIQVFPQDLAHLPGDRFTTYVPFLPHGAVLPHCRAAVHHGGAGTTHAACRAGIPAVVAAHVIDQLFWGRELHRLGVGPRPLHRNALTEARLARRLEAVLADAAMARRARALGVWMRPENGVARAVSLVEALGSGARASVTASATAIDVPRREY